MVTSYYVTTSAKPKPELPPLPPGMRYRFHAMVKPVGSLCNLDCTYCYYLHKESLLNQPPAPRMSDDMLERHIRQYIEAQTDQEVVFSWQGGEPTLLGIEFFQKVVALQTRYKKPHQAIQNDLQTNGTLLDDRWAQFLKRNHFLIGLSCDGPRDLHDAYRVNKGGRPTHAAVMAAARLLRKHGVGFNVLCVVNRQNATRPLDVYRFLSRELGVDRIQFIPGVEPRSFRNVAPQHWNSDALPIVGTPQAAPGAPDSIVADWSVDPSDWGAFLCSVWDDWFRRDYSKIFVDIFESAIAQSIGLPSQRCVTAECCGKALAIEHNGDVFSCDHYVYPEYRLGNIATTHWSEMAFGERQNGFGTAKRDSLPRYCRECPHLNLCWGECPRNRFVRAPDGEPGLNYLCHGLKKFYSHIHRDLPEILRRLA
jgi:uncharacterized protein